VTPPFVRVLYPPSDPRKTEGGQDVVAHKRALSRAGRWPWQPFDDDYNERFSEAVADLQRDEGIQPTGFWGEPTQTALAKHRAVDHPGELAYDATAIDLLEREHDHRAKSAEQKKAEDLLAYCYLFDGPYVWGGGHDGTPLNDSPHAGADCSGSTSDALAHVGLLGSSTQHVSGWFKTWGDQARGKYVTVHAANDHVWVEFTIPGKSWARFDTSPHGDGPTGPRVRHKQRDASRFVSRHPRGL
jgi:cell wall-associated NlpC family hydrolase